MWQHDFSVYLSFHLIFSEEAVQFVNTELRLNYSNKGCKSCRSRLLTFQCVTVMLWLSCGLLGGYDNIHLGNQSYLILGFNITLTHWLITLLRESVETQTKDTGVILNIVYFILFNFDLNRQWGKRLLGIKTIVCIVSSLCRRCIVTTTQQLPWFDLRWLINRSSSQGCTDASCHPGYWFRVLTLVSVNTMRCNPLLLL